MRPGGFGRQTIEDGLEVVQLGSRASFHAVLNLTVGRSGGEVLGHQHRHPVPAGPGQRDAHQHVIAPTVGLVALMNDHLRLALPTASVTRSESNASATTGTAPCSESIAQL